MDKLNQLITRLSKFHWSPLHPSKYVIKEEGKRSYGLGLIAHRSYGAFNLTWRFCEGKLTTLENHQTGMNYYIAIYPLMTFKHKGANMDTWLTLLQEKEFEVWWKSQKTDLPTELVVLVEAALAVEAHG